MGCMDCGMESELDCVLTKTQWLMINPKDGGMLCANCIIKRAAKLPHVINLQCYISFADDYIDERKSNFACHLMEERRECFSATA